jgi:hypothetical protein
MRRSKLVVPYGSHVDEGSFPSCSRLFSPRLSLVSRERGDPMLTLSKRKMQPMSFEKELLIIWEKILVKVLLK